MKKHIALGLVASTLFLAGCCTTHHVTQWDYMKASDLSDIELNKYGVQGWSLVGYTHEADGHAYYVFKRPKQ